MEWLSKTHCKGPSCDVYVSKGNINGSEYIYFRFSKAVIKLITKTNYIVVAVDGTRLYFDEADARKGWKVSNPDEGQSCYLRIKSDIKQLKEVEIGSYSLEFDNVSGYYFIDSDNKLEKKRLNWRMK